LDWGAEEGSGEKRNDGGKKIHFGRTGEVPVRRVRKKRETKGNGALTCLLKKLEEGEDVGVSKERVTRRKEPVPAG